MTLSENQTKSLDLLESITPSINQSRPPRETTLFPGFYAEDGKPIKGEAAGWYFHVPSCFCNALDIKQTARQENKSEVLRWTQGSEFNFTEGCVIYDSPVARQNGVPWGEALKSVKVALQVVASYSALPATVETESWEDIPKDLDDRIAAWTEKGIKTQTIDNRDKKTPVFKLLAYIPRNPGNVTVRVLKPNEDHSQLVQIETITITQDELVKTLISGLDIHKEDDAMDTPETALGDIIAWSEKQPMWQREALRVLATSSDPISTNQIDRLVTLCKQEAGLKGDSPIKAEPISSAHMATPPSDDTPVTLKSISEVQGINALKNDAQVDFSITGLTLLYGMNGSGKTGFSRVLKQTCRCADKSETGILSNVFNPQKVKSAKITYSIGDSEKSFVWNDSNVCPDGLQSISIFDTASASVYVTKQNEVAFTPYGIHILSELAESLCSVVKTNLQAEQQTLVSSLPDLSSSLEFEDAEDWFKSISFETKQVDIDSWASFNENDAARLKELNKALSEEDPQQKANLLKSQKLQVEEVINRIKTIQQALSESAVCNYKSQMVDTEAKKKAAILAAKDAFSDSLLSGVGASPWKQLWSAAKVYVEKSAYPNQEFPTSQEVDHCPLCQQKIDSATRKRLVGFEEHIKATVQNDYDKAKIGLDKTTRDLEAVAIHKEGDTALMESLDKKLVDRLTDYLSAVEKIQATIVSSLDNRKWGVPPEQPISPLIDLNKMVRGLDVQITTLLGAVNEKTKIKLEEERNVLASRKVFSENKVAIEDEVKRQIKYNKLNKAIKLTASGKISTFSGSLTKKYVTDELREAFETRLKELFGDRNFVSLQKAKTKAGTTYYELVLNGDTEAKVKDIVSEGEFRAIALAAFLAEIDVAPHSHGVVFDDPVSSLDHIRRETIGNMLIELSRNRQVVVFTHDLFFVSVLTYGAQKNRTYKLEPKCMEIFSASGEYGHCVDGLPMEVKKFEDRRKLINSKISEARKALKDGNTELYQMITGNLVGEMRRITERAVEEVLFNGVVLRFDRSVRTQQLDPKLTKIKQADLDMFVRLMDKYSVYPHDQQTDRIAPIPDIDVIERDLQELRSWKRTYGA